MLSRKLLKLSFRRSSSDSSSNVGGCCCVVGSAVVQFAAFGFGLITDDGVFATANL